MRIAQFLTRTANMFVWAKEWWTLYRSGCKRPRWLPFKAVVGSGLSSEHREVFCPSSARSRITYMFVWLRHGSSGHFILNFGSLFCCCGRGSQCKAEKRPLQHATRKLRVCYTHTNARQTCDGMCVPTTALKVYLSYLLLKLGAITVYVF